MKKSVLVGAATALGVVAGVIIERYTGWFDHLMIGDKKQGVESHLEKSLLADKSKQKRSADQKKNFEKIESQMNEGGGLTNEAATGNND